ncbi:MAG: alpha/beta fold hydrolase [Firmicutes bacterium]|nr:alpha/beta fold hydrolase [Bacillota bacterium]
MAFAADLERHARELAAAGRLSELESLLARAQSTRRMDVIAGAAQTFLDQEEYDDALVWMKRALNEAGARPIELLELGRYAEERHREPRVLALSIRLLGRALAERHASDPSLEVRALANLAEAWHRSGDAARAADLLQRAEDAADRWAQSGSHHGAFWRWMLRFFRADLAWDAGDRERAAAIFAEALRDPMAGVEYERFAERCAQVGIDVAGLLQARGQLDAELTYQSEASRMKLATADGKTLWASLWEGRAGRPGIVLIPMAGHSRHTWRPWARELSRDGWWVLALDARGQGLSVGPDLEMRATPEDGLAALAVLSELAGPGAPLALMGASYGGAIALLTASRAEREVAMVLLSPARLRDRGEALDAASQCGVPVLLVTSVDDGAVTKWNVEMFEHAPRGRWELRVVPEAGHGTYLLEVRPGLWGELLDWLGPRLTGGFTP